MTWERAAGSLPQSFMAQAQECLSQYPTAGTQGRDGKAVIKASGGSFSSCTADCENTHCLVTHGQGINYSITQTCVS